MQDVPVIHVESDQLDDLRSRLRRTRWGQEWPVRGWDAGTDRDELRRLVGYWADDFDWPDAERRIRDLPWASADLDGTAVRYLRFDAEAPGALPVIMTNGWPSTALEMVEVARRLASPSQYGGSADDALTVIVPAIPGLPFSPQRPALDDQTHELWHTLMSRDLGFARYGAHGGDLGVGITSRLAERHPEAVVGIHLLAVAAPPRVDPASVSAEERAHLDRVKAWSESEGAYQHQHQTRPLSLAPALSDSPAGLLAWILEKYRAWSDCDGDLSTRFSDDELLTAASVYWFTDSISTSLRPYWEFATGLTSRVERIEVPTAVAVFPRDLARPPRSWAERAYNVVRFTEMPRGGHFAPHEEPDLLADDIREFFTSLR